MRENAALNLSRNPFEDLESGDSQKIKYYQKISFIAQHFIFSLGELNAAAVEQEISKTKKIPDINSLEAENHGLESLHFLLKGIEAHEKAEAFNGAWQAELSRQEHPEDLTREQVSGLFQTFKFKDQLLEEENKALAAYDEFLKLENPIALNMNISLELDDIRVLMNGLLARRAERIENKRTRDEKLIVLETELVDIANAVPEGQVGKRLEIEELYILRQRIRKAGMGHLATIEHSSPRLDLNPKRKSVDLVLSAAGKIYNFQIKSFKDIDNETIRAQQLAVLDKAKKQIAGSETFLAILDTDSINNLYAANSNGKTGGSNLEFSAISPLTEGMDIAERQLLLKILGLTEQDFRLQEAEVQKKKEAKRQQREKEAEVLRIEVEREARATERKKLIAQQEAEARAKLQAILDDLRAKEMKAALEAEGQKQAAIKVEIAKQEAVKAEFERKVQERIKQEQEIELKKQEQIKREAEAEAWRRAEQESQDRKQAEERARQEAIQEQQKIDALKAQIKRQEALDAERQKQEKIRITLEEASKRETEKREQERRLEEENRKKEEKRKSKENIKKDWPPKDLVGMANYAVLNKLGFLSADYINDVTAFLTAKRKFIEAFASAGKSGFSEKNKPNKSFAQVFPNKDSFESPDESTLKRFRDFIFK